ncbi:LOW QUALITY PROTEIN: dual specificity tyrosine-phosphorylation-regulated kinase 4-like [Octopus sinensis]|uniref:dual-specificity kinase n=1 Tax=Octopus sinensis TaxID=2607531 RepID=A0A6P7U2U0_9MOLL|nr:LOW QUALITY PROTEIN: dual specificity tyrosine-phosphorylation-regulated kinase 4-like [Octopus sinensis]
MSLQGRVSNTPMPSRAQLPMSGEGLEIIFKVDCLLHFGNKLTTFEQSEILKYKQIWYFGSNASKRETNEFKNNNGFDNEQGFYIKVFRPHQQTINDHLHYRFQVIEELGKGSFGQVLKCHDHKLDRTVAVKLIRNKRVSFPDEGRFHQQALMEVEMLDKILRKDTKNLYNVVHMNEYFYFRNHLCICFELLGLYEALKRNNFGGMSLGTIRKLNYHILQSLVLLYKEKIIHCDLKPVSPLLNPQENILLLKNSQSKCKIIDFGSSCHEDKRCWSVLLILVFSYIQSRFYRAPEVILGIPYSTLIDMWSLGCILAELYTGNPLFPGENEHEQLSYIIQILDYPPTHMIANSSRKSYFFGQIYKMSLDSNNKLTVTSKCRRKSKPASKSLASAVGSNDTIFVDFIAKCLEL